MWILNAVAWPYAFCGLLVGSLIGLTGVGGGSLMTPLLVLLFGVSPAMAVGTDLLFACVTKSVGVAMHGVRGSVDWRLVARLAAGSVPATILTVSWIGAHHRAGQGANGVIATTLGIALILTAIGLIFRRRIVERLAPVVEGLGDRCRAMFTVLLGMLLGVFVSMSSVGAGAIGVTVLLVLYPRLPTVKIVGSDIAHAVPLTLVAGMGHWAFGSVDLRLLSSLLVGSIPGIVASSLLSNRVPDAVLRPLLATTLAVVGLRLAV